MHAVQLVHEIMLNQKLSGNILEVSNSNLLHLTSNSCDDTESNKNEEQSKNHNLLSTTKKLIRTLIFTNQPMCLYDQIMIIIAV